MKLQFRKLRADEIDVRVGSTKSEKGTSLLLYKDARCDMNILDETVGAMGWKREHARENANCIVSIWDGDKSQWVSKEDTGTESFTEQEKGLASDSFKRACFNWGIGRELYTAGLIFISANVISKNDIKYKRFTVTQVKYDDLGNIEKLKIECDGKVVYEKGKFITGDDKPTQEPKSSTATDKQIGMIKNLYTPEELDTMLTNLKKDIYKLTVQEASTMIKARKGKS